MSSGLWGRTSSWVVFTAVIGTAACGGTANEPAPAPEPEAPAAEAVAGPRIFFVEPADGATLQAPVHLVFGAENFTVEPVGDGAVHAGAGHMHIGVDTECLPAGEVIPTASPWVHFGKGQMEFDLDLTPGEHHIVLQVGDGEHRTQPDPGLCSTLTLNIE